MSNNVKTTPLANHPMCAYISANVTCVSIASPLWQLFCPASGAPRSTWSIQENNSPDFGGFRLPKKTGTWTFALPSPCLIGLLRLEFDRQLDPDLYLLFAVECR